jgi:hypothetical protein
MRLLWRPVGDQGMAVDTRTETNGTHYNDYITMGMQLQ